MQFVKVRRIHETDAVVTIEQAAILGIDSAFTIRSCTWLDGIEFKGFYHETRKGHGIVSSVDLSALPQCVLFGLHDCAVDINDYSYNQDELTDETFMHFECTNCMYVEINSGTAFYSDMVEAVGYE